MMSDLLDSMEELGNRGCITDAGWILRLCKELHDLPLSSFCNIKTNALLQYSVSEICKGYEMEEIQAVNNLSFYEYTFLILATEKNDYFFTATSPDKADPKIFGRTLGAKFIEGMLSESSTNDVLKKYFKINFNEYVKLCKKHIRNKSAKQYLDDFYNKYDEMNWGVILENTTLGDVINSLLTATRRTYFPGVHDIYFYASKVEAANDYLVFLVFDCLNYLFSITRNNNYVDIFASYKLGGE